jgi:hypothetical protein
MAGGNMRAPARLFATILLLTLAVVIGRAQMTWQPSPPPLVTAENTAWFQAGEPIMWEGSIYYPAGALQAFNPYQMVRSGSFRGIPLYTDATLEPYSVVFVPLAGARMQPYERRRTGVLAGTAGSRAPSFPGAIGVEGTVSEPIAQALAPPTFAGAYEVTAAPPVPNAPATIGQTGTATAPRETVGTSGSAEARPPNRAPGRRQVVSRIWIDYNGRRWIASGKAVALTPNFEPAGTYRGFPVYTRKGETLTIYIPSTQGLVVPFTPLTSER